MVRPSGWRSTNEGDRYIHAALFPSLAHTHAHSHLPQVLALMWHAGSRAADSSTQLLPSIKPREAEYIITLWVRIIT